MEYVLRFLLELIFQLLRAFKATDDAKEGIELEMQKDYARNFRENTFKEGLSIYTPTDEKGWQKLDEDFAARFLIDTL